jgi:hypothetical protein
MADGKIAKEIGRSLTPVQRKRLKLGIASADPKHDRRRKVENAVHL